MERSNLAEAATDWVLALFGQADEVVRRVDEMAIQLAREGGSVPELNNVFWPAARSGISSCSQSAMSTTNSG